MYESHFLEASGYRSKFEISAACCSCACAQRARLALTTWSIIEGVAFSLWSDLRETFSQMASSPLWSYVEIRRRLGGGTLEATGVSDTKAAPGCHAERRCSRRGNLCRGSPHSF